MIRKRVTRKQMVGQKVGKLVARVAQIQIVEGEGSMKRSLNSITANSSRNEEQKIIDTENHGSLEIDFLRQYLINIPIDKDWDNLCLAIKSTYTVAEREERSLIEEESEANLVSDEEEEEEEEE